jgi:membrane associated rhomboid family serine protease
LTITRGNISMSLPPFPKVVKTLVILNAGIFLLTLLLAATVPSAGHWILAWLGLVPMLVAHGAVWQVVTYAFLHGGILHIAFNMLALWMFGSTLEVDWGRRRFLELYFFSAVGAALVTIGISFSGTLGLTPNTSTIGASGAIYGLLIAFGMVYGERELMLFPLPFVIKAKYFIGAWIFIALALALQGSGSNVAHLGGVFFGYLYVKLLLRRRIPLRTRGSSFSLRDWYYRWKRRRAAKQFEVYMREHGGGTYVDPLAEDHDPRDKSPQKKNGESREPWIH